MEITTFDNINSKLIEDNEDILYIIEDNELNSVNISIGKDLKNVLSIKTKKNFNNRISSFFRDDDFEKYYKMIFDDIIEIKTKFYSYNKICLSSNGYGQYMETHSPKLYSYLSDILKYNFGFNNKKKTIEKRIPSYNEIRDAKSINISGYSYIKIELIKNFKSIAITTDQKYKMGDIVKLKINNEPESIIGIVNIDSYNINDISDNKYNLFEGYTKSNKGNYQFHFEYVATVKNGSITFANNSLNKIDTNIKHINKIDDISKMVIEPIIGESDLVIDKPDTDLTFRVVKSDKSVSNKYKILSKIVEYELVSVLELSSDEFLVIDTMYFYRIKDFTIISKIDIIDYKVLEVFGRTFLYIKENILGVDRLITIELDLSIKEVSDFLENE